MALGTSLRSAGRAFKGGTGIVLYLTLYPLARAGLGLVYRAVATHVPRATCRGTPPDDRRRGRAPERDARPCARRPDQSSHRYQGA